MLIHRATLMDGRTVDIRAGAQIEEVGEGLVAGKGEGVLYAGGGTVLPGLHDHHVHLRSAAGALDSFFVGPPGVSTKTQLTQLLSNATPGQRAHWELNGDGVGVHWPDIDEDLSAPGVVGLPD